MCRKALGEMFYLTACQRNDTMDIRALAQNMFKEESSGEITKGKVKALIAIVAAALVLPLIFNIGSGFGSSGGTHERTCASCGRSFEAGDAAGNYMNIAKTGFCNNCDDNREFFEWILGPIMIWQNSSAYRRGVFFSPSINLLEIQIIATQFII